MSLYRLSNALGVGADVAETVHLLSLGEETVDSRVDEPGTVGDQGSHDQQVGDTGLRPIVGDKPLDAKHLECERWAFLTGVTQASPFACATRCWSSATTVSQSQST